MSVEKKTMLACSYKVPLSWRVISRMCRTCRMLMEMHRSWESQTSLSSRPQTPQGKGLRLPHSQHLASTWNTGGALYKEKYMIIINQKIQASWMHSHLIFLRLGCLKCFLKSIYLHLVLNELPSCFRESYWKETFYMEDIIPQILKTPLTVCSTVFLPPSESQSAERITISLSEPRSDVKRKLPKVVFRICWCFKKWRVGPSSRNQILD